ncbi:MAG TPA: hypothetical protein VF525_02585 [Pyrinomonadaceae bacterium]|jgi:hypothetical protein
MNDLETRRYEMMTRVRDYGATQTASFPPTSLGGEQFVIVGAAVEELQRHASAQTSGAGTARQGSTSRANARAALREDLQAITRTARVLALDVPGLESKFRLPRSGSDPALLNTARAFLADAEPLKTDFIRHELPADFLDDLAADIEKFERAINSQHTGKDTHVAATAAIDDALERGLKAVQRLDVIVRNKFHDDPAALAAWTSASHVARAPKHKPVTPQPSAPSA